MHSKQVNMMWAWAHSRPMRFSIWNNKCPNFRSISPYCYSKYYVIRGPSESISDAMPFSSASKTFLKWVDSERMSVKNVNDIETCNWRSHAWEPFLEKGTMRCWIAPHVPAMTTECQNGIKWHSAAKVESSCVPGTCEFNIISLSAIFDHSPDAARNQRHENSSSGERRLTPTKLLNNALGSVAWIQQRANEQHMYPIKITIVMIDSHSIRTTDESFQYYFSLQFPRQHHNFIGHMLFII